MTTDGASNNLLRNDDVSSRDNNNNNSNSIDNASQVKPVVEHRLIKHPNGHLMTNGHALESQGGRILGARTSNSGSGHWQAPDKGHSPTGMPKRPTSGKITGCRNRNPKRFVVTDLPDALEFAHDSPVALRHRTFSEDEQDDPHNRKRPGKTEVKGRFTIIDLSPASPVIGGAEDADVSSDQEVEGKPTVSSQRTESSSPAGSVGSSDAFILETARRDPSKTFICVETSTSSANNGRSLNDSGINLRTSSGSFVNDRTRGSSGSFTNGSFATSDNGVNNLRASNGSFATSDNGMNNLRASIGSFSMNTPPLGKQLPPAPQQRRFDNETFVFDQQLDALQRDGLEMKLALEDMMYRNANWLDTLAQTRARINATSAQSCCSCGCSTDGSTGASLHARYANLYMAYEQLQNRFDSLAVSNRRLEENNVILEARLVQEMNVNDALRSQLEQLTKLAESLFLESEQSELMNNNELEMLRISDEMSLSRENKSDRSSSRETDADSNEGDDRPERHDTSCDSFESPCKKPLPQVNDPGPGAGCLNVCDPPSNQMESCPQSSSVATCGEQSQTSGLLDDLLRSETSTTCN